MRSRSVALLALFLAVLLVGAGGVYAYDSSRAQRIAEGLTVSGVDVGGMTTSQARSALEARVLAPLREPVLVRHKGRTFRLTARQSQVGIDLDGSVDRALARSRDGNVLTRAVRDLSGGRVDADVPIDIAYSKPAVRRLVARVTKAIDRRAVDADVSFAGGRIDRKASKTGVEVRAGALRREIDEKLVSTDGPRTVRVRTRTVRPKVSTNELADKYPAVLMIDRPNFKLTLYKNLKPAKSYGIALGRAGMETPSGLYSIQNKAVNPAWNVPNKPWAGSLAGQVIPGGVPENPLKARWLGIYDGVGIHGTADEGSIGTNASHGCIRMRVAEVIELYDDVPVGAPIYIA